MVGLNRRFYATNLGAREALAAHGPLTTITVEAHEDLTRPSRAKFPPQVLRRWAYANGIHALDLLRFFGGEVAEVHAFQDRYEADWPDCQTAVLRFASGAHGRALVDYMAPGGHRYELRGIGIRASSSPGLEQVVLTTRGEPERRLELDADDRQYKPGFWKQDSTFLAAVQAGHQPPFPAASLADAHRTMVLIDQICGLPPA